MKLIDYFEAKSKSTTLHEFSRTTEGEETPFKVSGRYQMCKCSVIQKIIFEVY